jgi:SAM-dependent methyltransferase
MKTKTLDLGCGLNIRNPFNMDEVYGIDIRERKEENIQTCDLTIETIPFPDNYFDCVSAFDFIEHIPRIIYCPSRRFPFIELMSEAYRVLKLGGLFLSVTPAFPHEAAWRDPTHVNIITEQTFPLYFDDINCWGRDYGFKGAFHIESQKWFEGGAHLETLMRKVPELAPKVTS